ncbi:XAC2610-related protein [Paenibacillus glycanilyticus]|uniref:XAC2610-related protein n=1 Tax=Paenibacillus glycanilyticus TaxID=126569 RepID=UPI003EB98D16
MRSKVLAAAIAISVLLASCQSHPSNQANAETTSMPAPVSPAAAEHTAEPIAFKEEPPDSTFDQINSLIHHYQQKLVQAIDTNTFSEVEPYLAPGSSLYEAQSKLVADLYSRQITESLISSTIYGYTDKENEIQIEVTEKVMIHYPDKGARVQDFNWLYTAKQADGKLKLSGLEEWTTYDKDMEQRSGAVKRDGYYAEMLFDNYPAILEKAIRTLDLTDIRRISGSDTVFEQQKKLIGWFRRTGEEVIITAKTVKQDPLRQYGMELNFVDGYKGTGTQMVYFQIGEIRNKNGFGGRAVIDYFSDREIDDSFAADPQAVIRYQYIRIHPDMPEYLLKIYGRAEGEHIEDQSYHANKIELYDGDRLVQSIPLEATDTWDGMNLGAEVEDMNFDGFLDLRIQSLIPAGPNTPYLYWLWNPKSSLLELNKELEEITATEFDSFTQTIHCFNRDNAAEYSDVYYRYIEGSPVVVLSLIHKFDDDQVLWQVTINELINGKMQVTGQYEEADE